MPIRNDFEQNTPEWHAWRLEKLLGSRMASIWSARPYTLKDIEDLLQKRHFDLKKFQERLNEKRKARGEKAKKYTKADLEAILSDADKEELMSDSEKKLEFYQVLADSFAITAEEDEIQYRDAMERGHLLEDEGADVFTEKFKIELEKIGGVESEEDPRIANSPDRYVKRPEGEQFYKEAVEIKCLGAAKHLMSFFEKKVPEEYWTQKVQYFVTNAHLKRLYWVFYNPRLPILPIFVLIIERDDLAHWPETMLKYELRTLKEIDGLKMKLLEVTDKDLMVPARREKVETV